MLQVKTVELFNLFFREGNGGMDKEPFARELALFFALKIHIIDSRALF